MTAPVAPLELRLALAFAGPAARARLEPLYAIDAEIEASVRLEHAVAHARLGYWRDEVERLVQGRPSHPLARALASSAGAGARLARLHDRLDAAELALGGVRPQSLDALAALAERSHGALQALAAELLAGRPAPEPAAFGLALGRGLGLAVASAREEDAASPAALAALALAAFEAADAALPPPQRTAQTHGLVRLALARVSLARRSADPPRPAPGPFTLLLRAWLAARRARLE
jgi:phytoene synthase